MAVALDFAAIKIAATPNSVNIINTPYFLIVSGITMAEIGTASIMLIIAR